MIQVLEECVCVCVCVCEREKEGDISRSQIVVGFHMFNF